MISQKYSPFLENWYQSKQIAPLKTILGYSGAAHPTIYTGTYPETHNRWNRFILSPKTSPFRFISQIPFLKAIDLIPNILFRRMSKYCLSTTMRMLMKSKYDSLDFKDIPFFMLKFFDITEKKLLLHEPRSVSTIPTFFDILRKNGLQYLYCGWPESENSIIPKLKKYSKNADVICIYTGSLDPIAHVYGNQSIKTFQCIRRLDRLTSDIYKVCTQKFGNEFNLIVCSDHGFTDINFTFDVYKILRRIREIKIKKDYLVFYDATMIRFWYFNEKAKRIIQKMIRIEGNNLGKFLTDSDKMQLHLNFRNNSYGDDIFLLKEGGFVFPNFVTIKVLKGMHGYSPHFKSQNGIFMHNHYFNQQRTIQLVDILPTLLELLDIHKPSYVIGKSVL
jgi:predicted AlkP superfamily pyrophosphatase or phosphodiesterase